MRALWATFLLNTSFAIAQMFGARAANSLALLGDTGTMCVDSATYAINIVAEYHKESVGARGAAMVEIGASLISTLALIGVTVAIMLDAVSRLQAQNTGTDVAVDPVIMLIFTAFNFLIDIFMCLSIILRRTGGVTACFVRHFAHASAQSYVANSSSSTNMCETFGSCANRAAAAATHGRGRHDTSTRDAGASDMARLPKRLPNVQAWMGKSPTSCPQYACTLQSTTEDIAENAAVENDAEVVSAG